MGRQIKIAAAACILFLGSPALAVQAKEDFTLSHEKPGKETYVLFPAKEEAYEVEEGDSLWKIAERIWGDGKLYVELCEQNRETVTDPDLILPGQILQTTGPCYLEKLEKPNGAIGVKSQEYQFDKPQDCTVGIFGDECGANFTLFAPEQEYTIACLIREKEKSFDDPKACEAWEKAVTAYAEETYGDAVQNLRFEQYLSEKKEPVWLYSYTYVIDLSKYNVKGSTEVKVSAGVKQSRNMQAEFVGFSMEDSEIGDKVRYVTASFEETLAEGEACTVNGENMQIYPSVTWEASSFNAFAWVESCFDEMLEKITGSGQEQKSRKEKILDRMKKGK